MATPKTQYVCQSCGATFPRWLGKCPSCGGWDTFQEESVAPKAKASASAHRRGTLEPQSLRDIPIESIERTPAGIEELDRVLGGGFVPGSSVLFGGDPGVGKSTLLLQVAGSLAARGLPVLYISAEEAPQQIRMRAHRLELPNSDLLVFGEGDADMGVSWAEKVKPKVVVVDSIQTCRRLTLESAPGTVTQVREVAQIWTDWAKQTGGAVALVGHVTKEGAIAGPRTVEHLVDAVLMFEGDHVGGVRILRSLKNRFGSAGELGVFEMSGKGLSGVKDTSRLFLSERGSPVSGVAVSAIIRGSRPLLIEVQALVTKSYFAAPQRNVTGVDQRRLALWIAVLEKRVGLGLFGQDIFLNVAGGIRLEDAGADLAAAAAIFSSLRDIPLDRDMLLIGEVGLTGEVRAVHGLDRRVAEAAHLAFKRVIVPAVGWKGPAPKGIKVIPVHTLEEVVDLLGG